MITSLVLRSACLGVAAAALSLSAASAATPDLASASPAKNSFTAWPKQVSLTFDQPLSQTDLVIQMVDPDGHRIRLGAPVVSKDDLSASTEPTIVPMVKGPYMVSWQARTASGSQVKGDYTFFVQ
jgi:methionine-rich copper-binding protein CopC